MVETEERYATENEGYNLKEIFFKYFSFWPFFLISVFVCAIGAFIFLRYSTPLYKSTAVIEIIDKAQDSDMALPTAMTVFNRSMINLENEIGVLNSYSLHSRVVKSISSNVEFYTVGKIKTSQNHKSQWFLDFKIDFKIDLNEIDSKLTYELLVSEDKLIINQINNSGEIVSSSTFNEKSTYNVSNDLPFNIIINDKIIDDNIKRIVLLPVDLATKKYKSLVQISKSGKESEQLRLSMEFSNPVISTEYLNTLVNEFDLDGVIDRQLEHKRTMDFADSRSAFLVQELDKIELRRQEFKIKNKLTNISTDAQINISQKYIYDGELFEAESQRDLLLVLKDVISKSGEQLLPINIGLKNSNINELIVQHNLLVNEKNKYILSGAGPNNSFIVNINSQLNDSFENLLISINNFENSLKQTIENLKIKEEQFSGMYSAMPENEKILRAIERELSVKESLFLLLLQKREEAAINYAVVKPSVKPIDYARIDYNSFYPNIPLVIFLSILIGFFVPFVFLYIWFILDTKIHRREDLKGRTDIPIIGEIPYLKEKDDLNSIIKPSSRSPLAESIRMMLANFNFTKVKHEDKRGGVILVSSSVKGEGKTLISVNMASSLSFSKNKILLIGADLRNPQIHKFISVDKNILGLSDYLYNDKLSWENLLQNHDNFDILLSGTIPPNPSQLLASKRFSEFIDEAKCKYDYVIIDSAPTLLVSDTFEISKFSLNTIYIIRSSYSDKKLINYINETEKSGKLNNMNIVLNAVGNSKAYGYQYGYQYGYKYSYRYGYSYNYGYGYGYGESKSGK